MFSTPPLWHPGNVCRPGCFCRGCLRCCSHLSLLLLTVTSNAPKLPITRVTEVLSRQLRGDIPRRGIPRENAPRGSIQISPTRQSDTPSSTPNPAQRTIPSTPSPTHHRAHPALAPATQLPVTRSGLGIRFRHLRRRRRQSARGCLGS